MPTNKPVSAAELKKPEAPAKATDPKAAPAAEPKKTEAPAKVAAPKATPAVEPKKPEAPAKVAAPKATPAAEPKKPEAPAKAADPKTTPATEPKKPETPAKAADLKTTPAAAAKKPEAPAKATDLKASPAIEPKKSEAPAKTADLKAAPAAEPKKPEAPAKATDFKTAPAAEPKKPEAPAKAADLRTAPATEPKKSEAPAKTTDPKTTPAAEPKKPEAPAKATDTKTAPAPEPKKPGAPAKATDLKAAPAAEPKKTDAPAKATDSKGKPIEPLKSVPAGSPKEDPAAGPSKTADGPKGIVVTQVFADRLGYPSKEDLASLPIPKEGEGFSMRLHPAYFFQFLDHPFSINREVKDYKDLFESIKENGINEPVKARPREGGGLELLSGHRRHDVAMQLNYPVPVVIVQADDDTARIEVVDGNLHRQDIPTSELARAAKMKMEALARKAGRRSKMEQLAGPPPKRTDQQVAEDMGMSRNQVQRLVRIDSLVPELKQQVDDKKLPFNTAVELSYMKPEEQSRVVDFMAREQVVPSMAQATALKEASRQAAKTPAPTQAAKPKVDERQIASIVKPKKEPELRVTFTGPELADYFPKATPTVAEVKRTVFEALDLRKKALERQAKKQEIKDAAKKPAQQGDSR